MTHARGKLINDYLQAIDHKFLMKGKHIFHEQRL